MSGIREIYEQLTAWAATSNRRPIPFHFGLPDFDTPTHIKTAAKDALDAGFVKYTSSLGTPALRAAIARNVRDLHGLEVNPEREIVVTCGANEALSASIMALVDPGDEVILPDPAWPHYEYCLRLAGATPVYCRLDEARNFEMDPADVERCWSDRTRMVVINSPHNPTGAVMRAGAITAIAQLALERGAWLMSDEAYGRLIYEGRHFSPGSVAGVRDAVITVGCLSKTYAMTGWRMGYACGPAAAIDAINRVHLYTVSCPVSFAQSGAVAALEGDQACVDEMLAAYRRRRDLIVELLAAVPGLRLSRPAGAFYVFPNVEAIGLPSRDIAVHLVREHGVGAVPGAAFGPGGEGYLRLAYACSEDDIREGVDRMHTGLSELTGRAR